jgi:hypothetical protein
MYFFRKPPYRQPEEGRNEVPGGHDRTEGWVVAEIVVEESEGKMR